MNKVRTIGIVLIMFLMTVTVFCQTNRVITDKASVIAMGGVVYDLPTIPKINAKSLKTSDVDRPELFPGVIYNPLGGKMTLLIARSVKAGSVFQISVETKQGVLTPFDDIIIGETTNYAFEFPLPVPEPSLMTPLEPVVIVRLVYPDGMQGPRVKSRRLATNSYPQRGDVRGATAIVSAHQREGDYELVIVNVYDTPARLANSLVFIEQYLVGSVPIVEGLLEFSPSQLADENGFGLSNGWYRFAVMDQDGYCSTGKFRYDGILPRLP